MLRTALRVACPAAAGAALLAGSSHRPAHCRESRGVTPAAHLELDKLRANEAAMRRKWEEDEDGFHKLPPRAWPPKQPTGGEVGDLRRAIHSCDLGADCLSPECTESLFDLATCLVFQSIDPSEGLEIYSRLAAREKAPEAMVAVGVVLLEGIGVSLSKEGALRGLDSLKRAKELGSVQASYELGTLYYLGFEDAESGETIVAPNEREAFSHFERAAEMKHTGGLFMAADCLISGAGCDRDQARAVRLLSQAAHQGHRMARQYVREWLDEDKEVWKA